MGYCPVIDAGLLAPDHGFAATLCTIDMQAHRNPTSLASESSRAAQTIVRVPSWCHFTLCVGSLVSATRPTRSDPVTMDGMPIAPAGPMGLATGIGFQPT